MIVVTTFIKRRNFTFLSCEYPFQSFTGRMYTAYIVLVAGEVCARDQSISAFFCVFLQVFQSGILSNKLAELVVSIVVSFLAEFYRTHDNGYLIFILDSLLVGYLQNDICLSQRQIGQFVLSQSCDSGNVFQVVTVNLCAFVVSRRNPGRLTGLTVLLRNFSKAGTTLNSIVDAVG